MRIIPTLVDRLEANAAAVSVDNVAAAQRVDPSSPATAATLGRGALIATGPGRFVNRAIGVSVGELTPGEVDALEQFYDERGLVPALELSSWAPPANVALLRERGFEMDWFRSMFALDPAALDPAALDPAALDPAVLGPAVLDPAVVGSGASGAVSRVDAHGPVRVDPVTDEMVPAWLDVLAVGNGIDDPQRRAVSDEQALVNRTATGVINYVAVIDGAVAGCGSLQVLDGVAWVGGAATNPAHRSRGVQSALLRHRIGVAAELGCELVAATALPSGGSARNLSRLGFTHVQTQLVVSRRTAR